MASLAGSWTARGGGHPCDLILSSAIAETRAGGERVSPMYGARQEGDCGLGQRVWGWRPGAEGGVMLLDGYGNLIAEARRSPGGTLSVGDLTFRRA